MTRTSSRVHVTPPAPPSADYDVVIAPDALRTHLPDLLRESAPAHRYALISDSTVAGLLGERVRATLADAGLRVDLLLFEAGESRKTRETWAVLTDRMLGLGIGRDGCVLGLGGGVAGDLAGFVAGTYMRGIPVVQLPTTLLAMVDAAVGGKTGVDTALGKNLVGAFHQPRLVVADPTTLASLPVAELRAGLAEAVKHGAVADAAYLDRIERDADAILARDAGSLAWLVRRSVEIKAEFVAADAWEGGARKALNFGHTIGHAIESSREYEVLHGYAVAAGMVAEAEIGERLGVSLAGTADRLRRVLERVGLPTAPPGAPDPDRLLEYARRDKKRRGDRIHYTLLERPGRIARAEAEAGGWTHAVDDALVRAVLGGLDP